MRNKHPRNLSIDERRELQKGTDEEVLDGQPKKIRCMGKCNKELRMNLFFKYNGNSPKHKCYESLGVLPYCKDCLNALCLDKNGILNLNNIREAVQWLDIPFIEDKISDKIRDGKFSLGKYRGSMAISTYKDYTYDSWEKKLKEIDIKSKSLEDNVFQSIKNNQSIPSQEEISVLIDKWGEGYNKDEYIAFEHKYQQLKNNYNEKTAMHSEALLKYIRYSCKEEMATAKNDVDDAKKWGDMANKAATNAKINPSQLTKADLSDGLSTFSELSQAVEKEVDIIPILPKFKYRPNDALDFNIWCYINYMRDLSGLPPCKYEDVYAFYDKRKADYVKQYGDPYGIFTDDTSEKNRENIKQFIKEDKDIGSEE